MIESASIQLDRDGILVTVDAGFCAMMRDVPGRLVGRDMLTITAPADRDKCAELFAQLRATGRPIRTTKRLVRPDNSHFWVRTDLHRAADADGGGQRYVAAIAPSTPPSEWIEPERMLEIARMMQVSRLARGTMFDPTLFTDPAWDIMIAAYVAEAEGGVLTMGEIRGSVGVGAANATRWVRALAAQELIEREGDADPNADIAPIRLSATGHTRFERFLQTIYATATATTTATVE